MTRFAIRGALLAAVIATFAGGVFAQEAVIRRVLAERLPQLKIDEVTRTPVSGLYEVRYNGTSILYADEKGEYVQPKEPVPGEPEPVLTAADKAKRKEKEGVFVRRDGRAFFQVCEFGVVGEKMDVEVERGLQDGDEVISGPYQVLRTLKEWDRVELDPKRTKQGAGN